jgi:hypothetical protein
MAMGYCRNNIEPRRRGEANEERMLQEAGEEAPAWMHSKGRAGPRCSLCAYQQYANRGRPCETCHRSVCSAHYEKKITVVCTGCSGTVVPYDKDPSRCKKGKAMRLTWQVRLI